MVNFASNLLISIFGSRNQRLLRSYQPLVNAANALEESLIPYRIDVLDLAAVSPEMRAHVLKEGIVWNG